MRLLDADRDGVLSSAEIDKVTETLKALDRDGDGKLSMDEVRQAGRGAREQRGARGRTAEHRDSSQNESRRDGQRTTRRRQEDFGSVDRQIGLVQNTPRAFNGYTLFAPKHYTMTYLMDNEGRVVNSWESDYEPGQSVYLLPSGNLLHCCFTKGRGFTRGGEGGRLEEYDWEGNLVWELDYSSDTYMTHHDIEPLPNGNILALVVEKKTREECIAAGFSSRSLRSPELFPDSVIEIQPIRPKGGKIVWEWHVWDHLVQEHDRAGANYGRVADHPELISVNVNGRGAGAFWNHMNSIAYNPKFDQIMLSVRGCNELWIIDHSTTTEQAAGHRGGRYGKGGDLLYRWGNPAAYGRGDARDQMLFQQHDCQWIPAGCPGEGNILVFNNGLRRLPPGVRSTRDLPTYAVGRGWGYSSVDEIVPPVDKDGNYTIGRDGAFGPTELKWTYVAPEPTDFFAEAISGCQRLPNGNTLICDGTSGVLFEVKPNGEKVWEYVCPVSGDGPLNQGDPIPLDHRRHAMNAIFKVQRYEPNYPGLVDKDLTPGGRPTGSSAARTDRRRSGDARRNGGEPRNRTSRRDGRNER